MSQPKPAALPEKPISSRPLKTPSPQSTPLEEDSSYQGNQSIKLSTNWDERDVLEKLMSGEHFSDNLASDIMNISYHWRLFCLPPYDYLTTSFDGEDISNADIIDFYERLDKFKQVNIVETDVSADYYITEVEIDSMFSDSQSRSSVTTSLSMRVNEPNGVSFLDALKKGAENAGIENYYDFHYFLELSFKGYSKNGEEKTQLFSELDNGGRWLWTVKINNIDTSLGSGGGQYRLDMVTMDQDMLQDNNEFGVLLDSIRCSGDTIGEFFDDLSTKMNTSWEKRTALTGADRLVDHSFKFHSIPVPLGKTKQDNVDIDQDGIDDNGTIVSGEDIRNMTLKPREEDFSSTAGDSFHFEGVVSKQTTEDEVKNSEVSKTDNTINRKKTAFIPKGTSVVSIVPLIFSTCELAQNLATDSHINPGHPDESEDRVNDKGYRESVTWQIIPEVRMTGKYDDLYTFRYQRKIIWHVYPVISQLPILSETQIKVAKQEDIQKGMIAALAARDFLPKKYEYLFTGKNTEVLNIDLSFNLAWSVSLPRFESYYSSQTQHHARYNELDTEPYFGNALLKKNYYEDKASTEAENLSELTKELYKALSDGDISDDDRKLIKKVNELSKKTLGDFGKMSDAEKEILEGRRNQGGLKDRNIEQNYGREYIEDDKSQFGIDSSSKSPIIPFSYMGGEEARTELGSGSFTQYHGGKSLYGAVMNQMFGPTNKFQELNMTIKGDPFWLGRGSFETAINHYRNISTNGLQMNPCYGASSFMFLFKYPGGMDGSGNIKLSPNEVVTGIYTTTTVKHKFQGGSFTQELKAVRIPLINLFSSIMGVSTGETDGN